MPLNWSLAETVLDYQAIGGSASPGIIGSYVAYVGGLGLVKAITAGRTGDEQDDSGFFSMAAKALAVEGGVELAVELMRAKFLFKGADTPEQLQKVLPLMQAAQQGEMLLHVAYPLMVSQTLPAALISSAATGGLMYYMNVGVLQEYADVFRYLRPEGSDFRATFDPVFINYFEQSVIKRDIGDWANMVSESLAQGRLDGELRFQLRLFNVQSDVMVGHKSLGVSFLRGAASIIPEHVLARVLDQDRMLRLQDVSIRVLQSAGFSPDAIYAVRGVGVSPYQLIGMSTKQLAELAERISSSYDEEVAEEVMHSLRRLALSGLATASAARTSIATLGIGLAGSVLPIALDRVFGWMHLPNPVHAGINWMLDVITGRRRRTEEWEQQAGIRQEGWYGRHVGVGELSVGTRASMAAMGLPFEPHSRLDPSANVQYAQLVYGEMANLRRQEQIAQQVEQIFYSTFPDPFYAGPHPDYVATLLDIQEQHGRAVASGVMALVTAPTARPVIPGVRWPMPGPLRDVISKLDYGGIVSFRQNANMDAGILARNILYPFWVRGANAKSRLIEPSYIVARPPGDMLSVLRQTRDFVMSVIGTPPNIHPIDEQLLYSYALTHEFGHALTMGMNEYYLLALDLLGYIRSGVKPSDYERVYRGIGQAFGKVAPIRNLIELAAEAFAFSLGGYEASLLIEYESFLNMAINRLQSIGRSPSSAGIVYGRPIALRAISAGTFLKEAPSTFERMFKQWCRNELGIGSLDMIYLLGWLDELHSKWTQYPMTDRRIAEQVFPDLGVSAFRIMQQVLEYADSRMPASLDLSSVNMVRWSLATRSYSYLFAIPMIVGTARPELEGKVIHIYPNRVEVADTGEVLDLRKLSASMELPIAPQYSTQRLAHLERSMLQYGRIRAEVLGEQAAMQVMQRAQVVPESVNRIINEGWFGQHVGVGERSGAMDWVKRILRLPFKLRSGLDPWPNLQYAARQYGTSVLDVKQLVLQARKQFSVRASDVQSSGMLQWRPVPPAPAYRHRFPNTPKHADVHVRRNEPRRSGWRQPKMDVRYRSAPRNDIRRWRIISRKLELDRAYVSR